MKLPRSGKCVTFTVRIISPAEIRHLTKCVVGQCIRIRQITIPLTGRVFSINKMDRWRCVSSQWFNFIQNSNNSFAEILIFTENYRIVRETRIEREFQTCANSLHHHKRRHHRRGSHTRICRSCFQSGPKHKQTGRNLCAEFLSTAPTSHTPATSTLSEGKNDSPVHTRHIAQCRIEYGYFEVKMWLVFKIRKARDKRAVLFESF